MQISAKRWAWTCILQSSFEITFAKRLWRKQTAECLVILEMFNKKKKGGGFYYPFHFGCTKGGLHSSFFRQNRIHKAFNFQADLQRFPCWPEKYRSCQMKRVPMYMPHSHLNQNIIWALIILIILITNSEAKQKGWVLCYFQFSTDWSTQFMHTFYI